MSAGDSWVHGTMIVYQEVWDGRLWSARPVRIVQDDGDLLAIWCPRGTIVKGPVAPWRPGRSAGPEYFVDMFIHRDWQFGDFVWPTDNLMLIRPGEPHGVWVSWDEAGRNMGWYVNFQRPVVRTERGVQTMDLMLDLIVDQDLQWHWKDEDEFQALVDPGIIDAVEARCVRDDAETMVRVIESNGPPFYEPWHDWRPAPSWALPELPSGWDQL